jgi:predicted HicB family RNase H-like nuclease
MAAATGYFQLRSLSRGTRKAIKVAAALDGMTMEKWIAKVIKERIKRMGIQIEEEDERG